MVQFPAPEESKLTMSAIYEIVRTGRWGSIIEVYTDDEQMARATATEVTRVFFNQIGRVGVWDIVKVGPLESAPLEVDHGFRVEIGKKNG